MSASEETSRLHAQAQPVPVPPAQKSGDSTVPAVSVVIPSYNHARFLGEAIESVLAQTMPDLELIVLDDGSSDESIAIAEAIAARDGRVKVHAQPNAGSHETINRGLAMARAPCAGCRKGNGRWHQVSGRPQQRPWPLRSVGARPAFRACRSMHRFFQASARPHDRQSGS